MEEVRLTPDREKTLRFLLAKCPQKGSEDCGCGEVFHCCDIAILLAELDFWRKAYHESQSEVE